LFGTSGHESVYTKQEVLSVGLKPGEMFSFEEWLKALSNGVKDSLEKFERLEADWLIK
jgi:hypothetical protein